MKIFNVKYLYVYDVSSTGPQPAWVRGQLSPRFFNVVPPDEFCPSNGRAYIWQLKTFSKIFRKSLQKFSNIFGFFKFYLKVFSKILKHFLKLFWKFLKYFLDLFLQSLIVFSIFWKFFKLYQKINKFKNFLKILF